MPTKITTNQYGSNGANSGYGGAAGGNGGIGYSVGGSTVYNYAAIDGGDGGDGGFRTDKGGYGGAGGSGGAGVDISAGTLVNETGASIKGGYGGYGGYAFGIYGSGGIGGIGGTGVTLSDSSTLTNNGSITGGSAGYGGGYGYSGYSGDSSSGGRGGIGGTGVTVNGSSTLTNNGSITGGIGGSGFSAPSGAGGAGVDLNGGTLNNNSGGSITGGYGGPNPGGLGNSGGAGGAGVDLNGGTLNNNSGGSITGGHGGHGGSGGTGVYLNGGTLTTSGIISGGAGGAGAAAGDAVQFGPVASTLVVKPLAVFNGQVAANASVNDVLKLSGHQSGGTPITLGTQFTGFSTLAFASGAHWTVDVSNGAAASSPGLAVTGFTTSDTIDVTNLTPTQVAGGFNPATHVLTTASDGTLHFVSGPFSGEYFLFSSDGGTGTDIAVVKGSGISTTVTSTVTLGSSAHPSPLTITNTGVVSPIVAAAMGVFSNISGNSLTNNGAIHGGAGSNSSVGGIGGMGVNFKSGTTLTNTSSITGGTGGSGSSTTGGAGGAGVNLLTGTLTNSGSITGGTGGAGTTTGGHGGAGVNLNGGTLITSGTISGGAGGAGTPSGAVGDAVQFGTVASTLIVDPGALFNDKVVANASVHDVLELSGAQSGGTAITLGTEFTNFSTLNFAAGAAWTADATVGDLTQHPLTVDGFGTSDTLDITNLAKAGTTSSFNTTNDILTIAKGATTIHLQFDSTFTGEHFVLAANGSGTNVSLQPGAAATLAALAHDFRNFVGDEHRTLMGDVGDRFMLGAHGFGSGLALHADPVLMASSGHGFSSNAFTDRGLAHESVMLR